MTERKGGEAGRAGQVGLTLRVALWGSLAALGAAFSLQRIRSFDYWWHLATGELIARSGTVPRADPFTFSVPGAPWVDIHWLHQLGLHGLHGLGGHDAVVIGKLLLVLMLLALLVLATGPRRRAFATVLALALGLVAASDRIMPRPELPTFVLLAAELALLERFRHRADRWILLVVLVHLVWANVHGLFALGLGVLALSWLGQLIDPLLPGRPPLDRERVKLLGVVTLLSTLVCVINPNGIDGLLYPVRQLMMIGPPELRAQVGPGSVELAGLTTRWYALQLPVRAAFVSLALLSLAAMGANWRRVPARDALLWLAFLALAGMAVRNVALFGVVAAPILARHLGEIQGRLRPGRHTQAVAQAALALGLASLAVFVASGRFSLRFRDLREPGLGVMEVLHPVAAVDWIELEEPPGPIYHDMGDGGYLIWRLFPSYHALADGRLEIFGDRLRQLSGATPEAFEALDRRYRFGTALIGYNHFELGALLAWLHESPEWRLAFADEVAAVFVRRQPGDDRPDLDVAAPDFFPPLEGERGVSDLIRRLGRARFFGAVGPPGRARGHVLDLSLRYGDYLAGGGVGPQAVDPRE